jgi:hypothetical protein
MGTWKIQFLPFQVESHRVFREAFHPGLLENNVGSGRDSNAIHTCLLIPHVRKLRLQREK